MSQDEKPGIDLVQFQERLKDHVTAMLEEGGAVPGGKLIWRAEYFDFHSWSQIAHAAKAGDEQSIRYCDYLMTFVENARTSTPESPLLCIDCQTQRFIPNVTALPYRILALSIDPVAENAGYRGVVTPICGACVASDPQSRRASVRTLECLGFDTATTTVFDHIHTAGNA